MKHDHRVWRVMAAGFVDCIGHNARGPVYTLTALGAARVESRLRQRYDAPQEAVACT